ncbi:MAG: hypothetical protein A2144_01205 [Chloroflexi bacterium RBG_16_50_9]|nr:MAG: hypothetical protein A2Z75_01980 [Chloroflexi bacterium RBG_13_50_10]OGO23715.1 MAG: hypothetical protein A2144_01205 [Chloroflexi bacterium RBG_16_50_9]
MNRDSQKLGTSPKIAIIGGGPAGSFFALYVLHYARELGIRPEITVYQGRNLNELGPKGCKGCAGVISVTLLRNLGELGLNIPPAVIQTKIERYTVHSPYTSISIDNPEKDIEIASVYRGGGPRLSHFRNPISFDGWLLGEAQSRGITVENQRVSCVYLEPQAQVEVAGKRLSYDLVVLASGVNTKPVQIVGLDYAPPKTGTMAQDELYAGTAQVESRLGNVAHVFLIPHSRLIFGTLVPKGPFINVSVLSSGKQPVSVADFLSHDLVRSVLPEHYEHACGCRPRVVVSAAVNYYADRFVAIGDAAVTRLYKDGIGSSLLTARQAARTVVYHGLSRQDFERHYQPFCNSVAQDNWWGRLVFSINDRVKDSSAFLLAQQRLIGDEQENTKRPQPFTKAAWGMFTGSYRYSSIAKMAFSPASLVKLDLAIFREGLRALLHEEEAHPRRLHVGSKKVLILGGGFGGTYTLRHLIRSLNKNENIETTMVSDENFFLFTPLLHEAALGGIESRHIAYPIRRLHWRDRFNFINATVENIDLEGRKVNTTAGTLDFDYLILALGSVADMPDFDSTRAMERNIFTLKTLRDAQLVRNHIIGVFEQASIEMNPDRQSQLLTFIVAGAGYTGVQVVTELRDFIYRGLVKFYRTIDPGKIRIILVEAEPEIGVQLHARLGAYAMQHLQRMNIEVRLESRVTHAGEDDVEINDGEIVPAKTLIWVAGVAANRRIAELDTAKDNTGRVLVNEYLEIPGVTRVYALGDCAHFADPDTGQPIPPRAHIAARQSKVVAHNILADIRGRDKKPYCYSRQPEIVSLGTSRAIFRFHNLRLYGFWARLIWIGAYSLLVPETYNRVRIIMDWLLSLVFGRDITLLKPMEQSGPHRPGRSRYPG